MTFEMGDTARRRADARRPVGSRAAGATRADRGGVARRRRPAAGLDADALAEDPTLEAELADLEGCLQRWNMAPGDIGRGVRWNAAKCCSGATRPPSGARQANDGLLEEDIAATARHIGRFEIIGELGRGGLGVVLLAHDPVLKRSVALKIPRPGGTANSAVAQAIRAGSAGSRTANPSQYRAGLRSRRSWAHLFYRVRVR